MIHDVKLALRISSSAYDDEIMDLIETAKFDLRLSGVVIEDNTDDPLIKRAVITFSKANFGLDAPNAERFQQSYEMLKQHLSLAGDYNGNGME